MPMDGVMLGFVARQLDTVLRDGRVDRVIQPEKDEIHLVIRAQGVNHRLVLSAAASAARVHLSEHAKTGPMEPPMFCMLLRKYLCGGRVLAVRRIAGDRILEIDISNLSELGDPVTRTMVVEIMGRHSNIILRAADGRIVDAVRHVGQDISRVRQVLPGLTYAYPPAQGKLNPETATAEEIALRLAQEGGKLDPVFMFDKEGWEKLIPVKREIIEPYIFAYFLGETAEHRRAVENAARKLGCKIVALRHLDQYVPNDENFGDIALYDVAPDRFLNLLRGASYVCTDSFHGSCFSIIHRIPFVTFNRYAEGSKHSKNSRIDTLCANLGLQDRRYNEKTTLDKQLMTSIDWDVVKDKLINLKCDTNMYLDKAFCGIK